MASEIETLLNDVRAFLELLGTQECQSLNGAVEDRRQELIARLKLADSAYRPSYLDMNGARRLRCIMSDAHSSCLEEKDDWARSSSDGRESSADCSLCPDTLDGSGEDWPPAKAPSCVRPDLSPDWGLSVTAATARALHSGPVYRGGPCRWYRRRGWASLLPGRLLVFSGPRASRPRLVLLLRGRDAVLEEKDAVGDADPRTSCCAACCAVYTARPRPGPAFELCCPGRKTHQLWVSDDMEATRWLEAIRRAADVPITSDSTAPVPPATVASVSSAEVVQTKCTTPRSLRGKSPDLQPKEVDNDELRDESRKSASLSHSSVAADSVTNHQHTSDSHTDHQQQYESMLLGTEEIYHDIASPSQVGPNYANMHLSSSGNEDVPDGLAGRESPARPLYDDIGIPPKTPDYCNLHPSSLLLQSSDEEKLVTEHLYDDIGTMTSRASVYELIEDPIASRGILCQ